MRTIGSNTQTLLDNGKIYTAHLIDLTLKNLSADVFEIIRMTDYHIPLTFNSNQYLAGGHLLTIYNVTDTTDLQINDVTVGFSGIDSTMVSYVLSYDYIDRPLNIYRAFLSDQDVLLSTHKIFSGRVNAPSIADNVEDGEMLVSVNASSYLSDFDKKTSRHTNAQEHQYYHPNDGFFTLWGEIEKEIIWGKDETQ
jgi:hypothetical protein